MLAYHYLAALELSRAAGLDVSALAAPAYRALREAGDRAFSTRSEQRPASTGRRCETAAMATRSSCSGTPRRSIDREAKRDACARSAREALFTAGVMREPPKPTHARRGVVASGRRDRCFEHLARAEELIRDQPPSRAKARVLSLSLPRVRSTWTASRLVRRRFPSRSCSSTSSVRKRSTTSRSPKCMAAETWREHELDLERSVEIALAINSPAAGRSYNNLAALTSKTGDAARSLRLRTRVFSSPSGSGID